MKKILSLLLVLAMALSLFVVGFAATSGTMTDGDNEIELPYKTTEASVYTYTATQTGTLYIMATEFGYSYKGKPYEDNSEHMDDWECTLLTVNGQALEGGYYGSVQVVQGQTYTFVWEVTFRTDFGWNATLNLSYTPDLLPVVGTEEYPAILRVEDCPAQSVTIPAGGTAHYILYDFDGGQLVITGENAYVMFSYINTETMETEYRTYEAQNGVVTVPMSSAYVKLQIGNRGTTDAVFTINSTFPEGIRKNPAQLVLGENVATTYFDDFEGYYFTWTAPRSGKMTLTFPNDGWTYNIHNQTANKFLGSGTSADANPVNPVVVEFKMGDVLLININSFQNSDLSIPGGDVTFLVSVEYGHEYAVTEEVAATCCADGHITYICTDCGHSYTETLEIDPKNHASLVQLTEGWSASCEEDGCRATWQCNACNGLYSDYKGRFPTTQEAQMIPAPGHSFGPWTDKGDGTQKRVCSVCALEEVEKIQCLHEHTLLQGQIDADCTKEGYTGDTVCTDCGEVLQEGSVLDKATHAYVAGEPTMGNCCTPSVTEYLCSVCGHSYQKEGQKNGDNHTQLTQIFKDKAATCQEAGSKATWQCQGCQGVFADAKATQPITLDAQKLPVIPHTEGQWITTKDPTESQEGRKEQRCTACGELLNHETLPATHMTQSDPTMLWIVLAVVMVVFIGAGAVIVIRKRKG